MPEAVTPMALARSIRRIRSSGELLIDWRMRKSDHPSPQSDASNLRERIVLRRVISIKDVSAGEIVFIKYT
jgi:hypothetical protein